MKHFTFKWLKRFYILLAIKLVLLAILLSYARVLFTSVEDYKEQAIGWLQAEYQFNISVDDISAGIDFSGMVLTLNQVELLDSEQLPFVLTLDHLFLHLNFWDSVTEQKLKFNSISSQGVTLTIKGNSSPISSAESQLTIETLKDIFLTQLTTFSVKNSVVKFVDQLGNDKVVIIEQLRWLNEGNNHQGLGKATLPNTFGENSFKFVIDLTPKTKKQAFAADLYVEADNLNITDYLVEKVNENAEIEDAVVGFEAWVKFSIDHVEKVQLQLKKSHLVWSQVNQQHSWALNGGLLQWTKNDHGWLFDSYNLAVKENKKSREQINIRGFGDKGNMSLELDNLAIKDVLPFYLLYSDMQDSQIIQLRAFDLDADIEQVSFAKNSHDNLVFGLTLNAFKNRPVDEIPGLSNVKINVAGSLQHGTVDIKLPKQKIYFDGQFSRSMPIKSGNVEIQWQQTETGLKLFSEQMLLKTNELDTITEFSVFLPNENAENQSPFLSLYSYASLNDASKAQYYFPKKAMGNSVFEYLEPTIQKGKVTGAQILWYGAFSHYPYLQNNGIFQAWVPLRNAQYDFYGEWQGLTNLNLNLLFENDYLLMNAKNAHLGEIVIDKLQGKVDHLNPDGVLTIKADINEDAQKISRYLKASPLKDSVGSALSVIAVSKPLSGKVKLTVPFNREKLQTQTAGEVTLNNNELDIQLADDLIMPLKEVNGHFSFANGNLSAKNISASLFDQPLKISFDSVENKEAYQVNADMSGIWKMAKLSRVQPLIEPLKLSGHLDWLGKVKFEHQYTGGYRFDVVLNSSAQGVRSKLPAPLYKNALQAWPTNIVVSGNERSAHWNMNIKEKMTFEGLLAYPTGQQSIPYFDLSIGQPLKDSIDKNKRVVNVNLDKLTVKNWYEYWLSEKNKLVPTEEIDEQKEEHRSLFTLDEVNVDIKHVDLFNQPLTIFRANATNEKGHWETKVVSDKLQTSIEYRPGIPARFDLDITKINFQSLDVNQFQGQESSSLAGNQNKSENLRTDFPEVFIDCKSCNYKEIDLSPFSLHTFPTKNRLTIDYLKIGTEEEFTNISGFWNQRMTNIIVDSEGDKKNNIVKRLGFTSPVFHQKAQLIGAFNWIGAPWEANIESLNGAFSAELTNGAITEVSDSGARLLSIFSLDGIRRSLNLEFDNVFAKGFNFDLLTLSANVDDGVISNDDFYLDGSAGKITGSGLIDLPNQDTNYKFSYSPAVTSSLPVLAAFAINPLTGAAVLMLTKILEPVVDTIIRVDFTVKGDLNDPNVKLVTRQRGQIKLENSEVLQEMNENKAQLQGRIE